MPLTKMNIQPGVFKDDTVYSQQGRWVDSEKVRFLKGRAEKIGGWVKLDTDAITSGVVRALLPFRANNTKRYIGIGTHSHFYLYDDGAGTYTDITPGSNYTAGAQHTTISSGTYTYAGIWNLDTLGEDLIGVNKIGGKLYKLDTSAFQSSSSTNAAVVSNAPSSVNGVVVHQDSGITICYGAHDGTADAPMRVAFTDINDITDWTPTLDNFAGAIELHGGNLLLAGIRTKGQILLFSDTTAFSMTFVGQPDVFQFQTLAENVGIVGPHAAVEHNGLFIGWATMVFMHTADKYKTYLQGLKCFAALNVKFNEVWWFYPTGSNDASDDITNYVIFNYAEQVWSVGTLVRGAWAPADIYENPLASSVAASTSYIYKHESGTDDESSAMTCSITSGDIELPQDGNDIMYVNDFIPDFQDQAQDVTVTLKFRDHPNGTQRTEETITSATSTTHASMRARGRQVSLIVSSAATSSHWRLGDVRFNIQPDGLRNT
jgi:hypothetical protein